MTLPAIFDRLRLPVIGSPLFIISGPGLVIAQCKAGIVGSFPALNARPQALLDEMLGRAGFRNASAEYGVRQTGVLPLEHVVARPPALASRWRSAATSASPRRPRGSCSPRSAPAWPASWAPS